MRELLLPSTSVSMLTPMRLELRIEVGKNIQTWRMEINIINQ